MSRDIPPLPLTDPVRLWYFASFAMAAVAASAVYGLIGAVVRAWPETFTTEQGDKT